MPATRSRNASENRGLFARLGIALALLTVAAFSANEAHADGIVRYSGPPPLSTLVKFDNRDYEITHANWVSLDPVSSAVVRKVGYGVVTTVNVATTSTGVYSSDSMVSPHVRYPGISVRPVQTPRGEPEFSFDFPTASASGTSIYILSRDLRGTEHYMMVHDSGIHSCMHSGSFTSCYRTN